MIFFAFVYLDLKSVESLQSIDFNYYFFADYNLDFVEFN